MANTTDGARQETRVGFIGLGQLGSPMVANLLKDGVRVRVYNRTAEKAEPLAALGAEVAASADDAVEPGGVLITCLANDHALDHVLDESPGLFSRLGAEGLHVSMSTIAPATARRLAQRHAEQGGTYLAAPVMGRPDAVAARMQSYLVSGPAGARARAKPLLAGLGRQVFEFGDDPTAAHVAKLSANFLIASAVEAMSEAFTLAKKNGLDPEALHAMLTAGLFACPIYKNYGRQIIAGDFFQALFRVALGLKDMALVSQLALESRTPMPLASLLRDRYTAAAAHGRGEWDWTAIAVEVEADAGLER